MRKNGDVASPGKGLLPRGRLWSDMCFVHVQNKQINMYIDTKSCCIFLLIIRLFSREKIQYGRVKICASVADSDSLHAHFPKDFLLLVHFLFIVGNI